MIAGVVDDALIGWIQLTVSGPAGSQQVAGCVDSGFNGFLSIPLSLVLALGLPAAASQFALLADGSVAQLPMCPRPLIGMAGRGLSKPMPRLTFVSSACP